MLGTCVRGTGVAGVAQLKTSFYVHSQLGMSAPRGQYKFGLHISEAQVWSSDL